MIWSFPVAICALIGLTPTVGGGDAQQHLRGSDTTNTFYKTKVRREPRPLGKTDTDEEYEARPTLINIGNIRPGGITEGPGSTVFVSEWESGGIVSVDVNFETGNIKQIIPHQRHLNRTAVGLWYDNNVNAIFVAGGKRLSSDDDDQFLGGMYVYNASNGDEIISCRPTNFISYISDVTVVGGHAYFSDSIKPRVMVLDVADAIDGVCTVFTIDLPEDQFEVHHTDDEIRSGGICPYGSGVIITHSLGGVFFLQLIDDKNHILQFIDIDDAATTRVSGCSVNMDTLYLSEYANHISVWSLSGGNDDEDNTMAAIKLGSISSPHYDYPASPAIKYGYIYTANSKNNGPGASYFGGNNKTKSIQGGFPIVAVRDTFETQTTSTSRPSVPTIIPSMNPTASPTIHVMPDTEGICKSGPFSGERDWADGIVLFKDGDELHSCTHWYSIPNSDIYMKQSGTGNFVISKGTPGNSAVVWENGVGENEYLSNNDDDGAYFTRLQRDGHLITRKGSFVSKDTIIWKSDKTGTPNRDYFLGLRTDMKYVELWKGTPKVPDRIIISWRTLL